MFQLIFGLIWTAISSLIAFIMYSSGANITVNGNPVSQAEFNAMLGPKILIGVFLAIGIIFIIIGIKRLLTNAVTSMAGVETHGLILNILPSSTYVNGRPILKAIVLFVEQDGSLGRYSEAIGMDEYKYNSGDFVKLKHRNKDINIISKVASHEVPYHIKDKLDAEFNRNFGYDVGGTEIADTVIINGVEYVRK